MNENDIGPSLKKIRQEKGLSLDEVIKGTKIHQNILKAIEGDSLTNLSPVYLKGFLKIYCKYLGVDPKEFIPDYTAPENMPRSSVYQSGENKEKVFKPESFLRNASLKIGAWRPSKRVKLIIVYIFIAIVIVFAFNGLRKLITKRPTQNTENIIIPVAVNQKQTPVVSRAKISTVSGVRLVISAKENCLVPVKADGRLIFNSVLTRGRSKSWQAKDKIDLSLGNAGGVELVVNGKRFSSLGKRKHPLKNIVITEKEGLQIHR